MAFFSGILIGIIGATVIWYFVLRNNRKKLAEFIDVPEEMWDKVKEEIEEFPDEVKDKLSSLFNKKK